MIGGGHCRSPVELRRLALYQWSYVIVWIAAAAFIAPPDIQGQLARLGPAGTRLCTAERERRGLASLGVAGGGVMLMLFR